MISGRPGMFSLLKAWLANAPLLPLGGDRFPALFLNQLMCYRVQQAHAKSGQIQVRPGSSSLEGRAGVDRQSDHPGSSSIHFIPYGRGADRAITAIRGKMDVFANSICDN